MLIPGLISGSLKAGKKGKFQNCARSEVAARFGGRLQRNAHTGGRIQRLYYGRNR